jgi:putative phage-type endonuclease
MKKTDILGVEIDPRVLRLIDINNKLPPQRSPEWYLQRNTRMTASSVASILRLTKLEIDHRANGIMELEQEKKIGHVMPAFNTYAKEMRVKCGVESSGEGSVYTEWGVTYEPVVKELYQHFNGVVVHEFGMIPHPKFDWLGASPDGVTSSGRMIEIKCPYSRVPKGMPKCQYWVQMQIQMECCGFNECDYLDIVVREYNFPEDYHADVYGEEGTDTYVYSRNGKGMPKGIVIEHKRYDEQGKEHLEYFYPPVLTFKNMYEENEWVRQWGESHFAANPMTAERATNWMLHQSETYRIRYWRVDEWNCCLVKKDEQWLQQRLPDIHAFWKLVLQYRKEGMPEKYLKKSKDDAADNDQLFIDQSTGHLTTHAKDNVGHENVECLFWDEAEEINQPVITNIRDTQIHRPNSATTKKRVAAHPVVATTAVKKVATTAVKKVATKSKTKAAAPAPSNDCLFDDSDNDDE